MRPALGYHDPGWPVQVSSPTGDDGRLATIGQAARPAVVTAPRLVGREREIQRLTRLLDRGPQQGQAMVLAPSPS